VIQMRTFVCDDCGSSFEEPCGTGRPAECPHCHGQRFHREATEGNRFRRRRCHRVGQAGGRGRGGRAGQGRGTNAPVAPAGDATPEAS
jgi:DNA-directed RNA polymerase subunit RPC12/RpoP